jgi:PAS domain S-box-containing protein
MSMFRSRLERDVAGVAIAYVGLGGLWILLSDEVLHSLADDAARLTVFQTYKELAFIVASAVLLVFMLMRVARRHANSTLYRQSAALDSSLNGFAIMDQQGRLLYVNRACLQMWGHERAEDVVGTLAADYCLDPEVTAQVIEHLNGKGDVVQEFTARRRDGTTFEAITHSQRFFDHAGQLLFLGSYLDITERKRADAALQAAKAEAERANNAKSRFLAAASHDLRQPLAALALYVGMLTDRAAPADRTLVRNIGNCVDSLSELLTDLLDLSKLDAGIVFPNVTTFAISDVFARVVSAHAPEAQLKRLRLRYVRSSLIACTDPILFERVLGNLVANAIRYTELGGVLVGCRRRHGKTWIEVWDTGIGIPSDKTDEIFEEFKQLANEARNRAKGSGLGLAIVAKTAALLDLQVRVLSQPGKGSMFAVELPRGRSLGVAVESARANRRLHVALVEDNALVRDALTCSLEAMGHHVVAAATGRELLDRLGSQRPDIVVSDYRLEEGETGLDVVMSARTTYGPDLPAVIVTGDTDPSLLRSLASRGIAVQHKPVGGETLVAAFDAVMKAVPP